MPVRVQRRKNKWRLVEPNGQIARTRSGKPRDGGGHATRRSARRQKRAINSNRR